MLHYRCIPDECYNEDIHEILKYHSESVGTEGREVVEVPDRWKNQETGETFTAKDFAKHHESEATRIFLTCFGYGTVGSAFYAYTQRRRNKSDFLKALKLALIINCGISVLIYLTT